MRKSWFFLFALFFAFQVQAQTPYLDSLQQIVNQNKQDTLHAKALLNIGINLERSNLKRSTESYWELLNMKEDPSTRRFKTTAAIRLAGNYSATGKLDSVDYYFDRAERYLQSNPNDQRMAYNLYNGRGIHYNRIGKFERALSEYDKAIKLDHQIIGLDNVAGLYINLSNVYKQMDDQKSNFDATYKALEIFEKTQNRNGLAFAYNSLGSAHYHMKNYEDAEKYLLKSMEYRKLLGDKRGEATVLGNLGNVAMDLKDHQKAIAYFSLAIEINASLGLKEMVGIHLYNLGKNYLEMEEYGLAIEQLQKSKKVLQEAGSNSYDAKILADMGKAQRMLSQEREAYLSLKSATETASLHRQYGDAITAYKNLKEYYQDQGNFKEAYAAQAKEFAYRDSLGIGALQAQLRELESKYAVDLKENEITLLKAEKELDKAELEKRKADQNLILAIGLFVLLIAGILVNNYRIVGKTKRLLEVERLRNAIARDLHDDLGSTLSSIQILTQMASGKVEAENRGLFSKINAQTSEMMDKLSDIVWSIHPANDSLENLLSKMQEFAGEILEPKEITYRFDVSEGVRHVKLDVEKRRNVFLIFKEAINNAAKYSDSRHLDIVLQLEGGRLGLAIKDDGKGFDLDLVKRGNGLYNMRQRAEMIGGKMEIKSIPFAGTSIEVQAPIT